MNDLRERAEDAAVELYQQQGSGPLSIVRILSALEAFATKGVAVIIAERDEARLFGEQAAKEYNDLLREAQRRVLTCAFCGQEYEADRPVTKDARLTAHIEVCQEHPLRAANREIALLREWCRIDCAVDDAHWRTDHPDWWQRMDEIKAALGYNPASDSEPEP